MTVHHSSFRIHHSERQGLLPLADSRVADPLFLAYSATSLSQHGITFEKARSTPHLRLPLERAAAALARTQQERQP